MLKEIFNIEFEPEEFIRKVKEAIAADTEFAQSLEDVKEESKDLSKSVNDISFNKLNKELVDTKKKLDVTFGSQSGKQLGKTLQEAVKASSGSVEELTAIIDSLKANMNGLDGESFYAVAAAINEAEVSLENLTKTEVKLDQQNKTTARSSQDLSNNVKKVKTETTGLSLSQKALAASSALASRGLRLLKTALVSTGIGALVVLAGSLVAVFVRLKDRLGDLIGQNEKATTSISRIREAFARVGRVLDPVVKAVGNFISNGLEKIAPVVENVVNVAAPILESFFDFLGRSFINGTAGVLSFVDGFGLAFDRFKKLGVGLITISTNIFKVLSNPLNPENRAALKNSLDFTLDSFDNFGKDLAKSFAENQKKVRSAFQGGFSTTFKESNEAQKGFTKNTNVESKKVIDIYQKELEALQRIAKQRETELLKERLVLENENKFTELEQQRHTLELLYIENEYLLEVQKLNVKRQKDNTDTNNALAKSNLSIAVASRKLFEAINAEFQGNNTEDLVFGFGLDPESRKKFNEEVAKLKAELDELKRLGQEEFDSITAADNAAAAVEQVEADKQSKRIEGIRATAQAAIQAQNDILNAVSVAEQQKQAILDGAITRQQSRLQQALELADKGNAEYVDIEKKRLIDLENERRESARKQLALDTALRASSILTGLAGAIADAKGQPGQTALRIAAIVSAIAQGAALVSSLNSSAPNLWEGTDYSVSNTLGNKSGRDSHNVNIDNRERVLAAKYNDPIRNIHSKDIPRLVNAGLQATRFNYPAMVEASKSYTSNNTYNNVDLSEIRKGMGEMAAAIQSISMNQRIDARGLTQTMSSAFEQLNRFKNV